MKTVVLDVETIADTAAMARAGHVAEEGEFAPWPLHELACASVLIVQKLGLNEPTFDLRSFSRGEMSERAIVANVERTIEDAQQIITYNGQAFDLPVLITRAILSDEPIPTLARLNDRCRPGLHYDLHQQVKGAGGGIKLAHLCAAFGIPAKMGANGESVAGLAAAGNWTGIEHYCETDLPPAEWPKDYDSLDHASDPLTVRCGADQASRNSTGGSPSTLASTWSPGSRRSTPDGVPVKIRSPGASVI